MQDEQQKIDDADISLQKSLNENTGIKSINHNDVGTAKAMIVGALVVNVMLAILFLIASRNHSDKDVSGLMYLFSVLFTGGLLGLSFIATAICIISGVAAYIRAQSEKKDKLNGSKYVQ